jgi:hypothetical protein
MSEELSKLGLLIKVMKMTSAEDNVALVAIRKANEMLHSEGWDWEKLLRGKVVVIGDPFQGVAAPPPQRSAPPPPQPPPRAAPPRPAAPPPQANFVYPYWKTNVYARNCATCLQFVNDGAGWICKESVNANWRTFCNSCQVTERRLQQSGNGYTTPPRQQSYAPRQKARRKTNPKSIHDLL